MASGDSICIFTPQQNEPTASAFATFDTRNAIAVLDFDDTTDESAVFGGVLPRNYAGGGLTVTIIWMATSATTAEVRWDVQIERHQDDTDDLDADTFAAVQSVTATTASASGEPAYDTIAFTSGAQMDSLAAAESFRLKITRDANHADDDMTGDAELMRLEVKET